MPDTQSSASEARQVLADRLWEIRLEANLTGQEHAARCGWHPAKTSRIENNRTAPSADDIRTWCRVCAAADQAEDLIASLRAVEGAWVEWRRMERDGLRHAQQAIRPLYGVHGRRRNRGAQVDRSRHRSPLKIWSNQKSSAIAGGRQAIASGTSVTTLHFELDAGDEFGYLSGSQLVDSGRVASFWPVCAASELTADGYWLSDDDLVAVHPCSSRAAGSPAAQSRPSRRSSYVAVQRETARGRAAIAHGTYVERYVRPTRRKEYD